MQHTEYVYNGEYYVRVIANLPNEREQLSNGQRVNTGNAVWVKVEDIEWEQILSEAESGEEFGILTLKGLYAGVRFDDMEMFLDIFEKEIVAPRTLLQYRNTTDTPTNSTVKRAIVRNNIEETVKSEEDSERTNKYHIKRRALIRNKSDENLER